MQMTTWRLQTVQGEERWIVGAEAAEQQRVREQWKKRIVFYSDVRTWHIPLQTAITKYQREATYLSESETSNCKGNKYRLWWAGLRHTDRQWPGTSWSEDSILTLMFCFFLLVFFFFFNCSHKVLNSKSKWTWFKSYTHICSVGTLWL